jgi:hypothetical protein
MSYFARLAQRSALSSLRPVAPPAAAPVTLEQHVQTVAPPPASQAQVSAIPEPAAPAQTAESTRSEVMAPAEPKAGHEPLATSGVKSLPLKDASAVDVVESLAERVSNAAADARLSEPEERSLAAAATMAAEPPVWRESVTRADARHSAEASAVATRAQDARRARSATRPSQVIAPSEDGPTEGLPQYRDDMRVAPPSPSDESRPPLRRPPVGPSLEQAITRDAAARRTDNRVEIHIGRISLQVSTPQPAAPAPVPLRESFAPHRHYLRLR